MTKKVARKVTSKRTIRVAEVQRLSFCNSKKLPRLVVVSGRLNQWVGIGWIDVGPDDGKSPMVVDG